MKDREIIDKSTFAVDEVLLYKQGKRNRTQMTNFIVRMMQKAREDERKKVLEEKWHKE